MPTFVKFLFTRLSRLFTARFLFTWNIGARLNLKTYRRQAEIQYFSVVNTYGPSLLLKTKYR